MRSDVEIVLKNEGNPQPAMATKLAFLFSRILFSLQTTARMKEQSVFCRLQEYVNKKDIICNIKYSANFSSIYCWVMCSACIGVCTFYKTKPKSAVHFGYTYTTRFILRDTFISTFYLSFSLFLHVHTHAVWSCMSTHASDAPCIQYFATDDCFASLTTLFALAGICNTILQTMFNYKAQPIAKTMTSTIIIEQSLVWVILNRLDFDAKRAPYLRIRTVDFGLDYYETKARSEKETKHKIMKKWFSGWSTVAVS